MRCKYCIGFSEEIADKMCAFKRAVRDGDAFLQRVFLPRIHRAYLQRYDTNYAFLRFDEFHRDARIPCEELE